MWKRDCRMLGTEEEGREAARTHARTHAYLPTCMHAYLPTYMHAYIHAYLHTYIHTHIQECVKCCCASMLNSLHQVLKKEAVSLCKILKHHYVVFCLFTVECRTRKHTPCLGSCVMSPWSIQCPTKSKF